MALSTMRQATQRHPKLLDQVRDIARIRHLSLRTEETCRNWPR
jgi:hypothetical protein